MVKIDRNARLAVTPFPCGQCLHCRINISLIWSTRLKLERDLHKDSLFVTLTYNDENLPMERGVNTLAPADYTKFLKKFRKRVHPRKIRTFGVGEYGKLSNRPHYHIIVFNTKNGDEHHIKNSWCKNEKEMGFIEVDNCSDGLVAYIAGYVVDKLLNRGQIDARVQRPFMRASKGSRRNLCIKNQGGIGFGHAKYIGYQIKQNKFIKPSDITEMVYGKNNVPLGRYLTSVIADECGIDEEVWQIHQEKYYDDLLEEIYQQAQRDKDIPNKNPYKEEDKALAYYDSIRAKSKQARMVQQARHKIYKSRNKI